MIPLIHGIHHVTMIGSEPHTNLDFYTRVLGLRLVKQTVNFDDPSTWHLYYADRPGAPGTIITFFPYPRARPGQPGTSQVAQTTLAIPAGTLTQWQHRLEAEGVSPKQTQINNQKLLQFRDPHGTQLALIEANNPASVDPWTSIVPANLAVRGIHSVLLHVPDIKLTADFLRRVFGLAELTPKDDPNSDDTRSFQLDNHQRIEMAESLQPRARLAAGSVHHIAFRVPDEDALAAIHKRLANAGFDASPIRDRKYFRSIYFREPGGVIFEIATDTPGFTVDEPEDSLGQQLQLPPWLEPQRAQLTQSLPPLTTPSP